MERRFAPARGAEVVDPDGRFVGVVGDLWPLDGGGDAEMVLVRVGRRFRRERYLPLDGRATVDADGTLRIPWHGWQVDDAPHTGDGRWGDPVELARSYWRDSGD